MSLKCSEIRILIGNGYNYEVGSSKKVNTLVKELTEFNLPKQSTSWVLNHPWGKRYKSNVPIAKVKAVRLPFVSKSPNDNYIFITEAALYNYGALSLSAHNNTTLAAEIIGDNVEFGQKSQHLGA
ncbi:MAG: glycoside hydrolase family 97 N-terminal domain-containing protein [Thalassotalea sp.]